jgi:DNA primase
MAFPPGLLDELRDRISLAQVVGRKVSWDNRKSNPARGDYWAPCPFHQEKSASFHVDEAKGYYYCFGCHAKGDVVTFVRETENLGFVEAVERLAAEAGLGLPARDPAAARREEAARGLADAMEAAIRFYRTQLAGGRAREARAYLDRRGMDAATRERFEIGYAPDGRTALLEHLTGQGFARDRLVEAGLVGLPRDGGGAYDRFRNRIMFPIRDARDRAIAFGARAIAPGQEPKYLNSPDTALFDKGRTLYNAGRARPAAAKAGTVIVTEGYMDVIALAQAGFDHAVAPLGTAITEAQLERLWRLAPEPIVALDGDAAGLGAAQRLIDLALPLLGHGRSLRFALLPPGEDPDDVIRSGGAPAMRALLDGSRPVIDLIWSREIDGQVLDSPERRAALDGRLRAHVARIGDAGLRSHWEAEIRARRLALFAPPARPAAPPGAPVGAVGAGARRSRPAPVAAPPSPLAKASFLVLQPDAESAEARVRESAILAGCLNQPALALDAEHRLERLAFRCPDLGQIRDALLSALATSLHQPQTSDRLCMTLKARLGFDPLERLMAVGQVRASRHLARDADPEIAARAIAEELDRHAALVARLEETREAMGEIAGAVDEALTARLRAAAEADHEATVRPLAEVSDGEDAEHREFLTFLREVEAQQAARKPRRH